MRYSKILNLSLKKETLICQSVISLSSKILNTSITLLFILYLTREISVFEMGLFASLDILCGIFSLFTNLGLCTTAIRFLPENNNIDQYNVKSIISTALILPLPLYLLCFTIVIIFDTVIGRILFKSETQNILLYIATINSICYCYIDNIQLINQGLSKFINNFYLSNIYIFSQRILAFLFIANGDGLNGIFWGFLFGSIIALAFGFWNIRSYIELSSVRIKYLKFSFPFYLRGFTKYALNQADQTIVALFFPTQTLGAYYIAKRIVNIFKLIFDSITDPVIVHLIRSKNSLNFKNKFFQISLSLIGLAIICANVLFFFSKRLIVLFAGAQYIEYHRILVLMGFVILFYAINTIVNIRLFIQYNPKSILFASLLLAVLSCIFQLVGGLYFSYNGVIIGQLLSTLIFTIMIVNYHKKHNEYFIRQ